MSVKPMLTCDRCGTAEVAVLRNGHFPYLDADVPDGWIAYQQNGVADIRHCCPDCLTVMRFHP